MSQKGKEYGGKSFLIPQRLFEIIKSFISTETFNSIKLNWNIFWRKFYKFTKTSFGIVILSNTRNMQFLFPLKIRTIINRVLFVKEVVLLICMTSVKPNVIQKLYWINIIIQLTDQNLWNSFEPIWPLSHMDCHFKCSKKC